MKWGVMHPNSNARCLNAKIMFLILWVICLRVISSIVYFKIHGPLASFGADIWYFVGVAKGYQHLFWMDPLQWVLPLLGGLRPETLFYLLLFFSNIFHLLSVLLLFGLLNEIEQDAISAFWASVGYSCFATSFNFCTASFHHQQVSLPVLVGLIWVGYRFWDGKKGRLSLGLCCAAFILAITGLSMGPDILVIFAWGLLCALAWFCCRGKSERKCFIFQTVILLIWIVTFVYLAPIMERFLEDLAFRMREISLVTQRQLQAADLMPFRWENFWVSYSWFSLVWIFLIFLGWWKGRFLEIALVITALLFASRASRFYTIAEIGFAVLLGWGLTQVIRFRVVWRHVIGGFMVIFLVGIAIWRGVPCFYPANISSVLAKLSQDAKSEPRVLCTPTYGFFIRGWTGAQPTSDWHHLNEKWVKIACQPAAQAVRELGQCGITHFFFTSYDYRMDWVCSPGGMTVPFLFASGGFECYLPDTIEEIRDSLVAQALADQPQIQGATLVDAKVDKTGQMKAVLFKLNERSQLTPIFHH